MIKVPLGYFCDYDHAILLANNRVRYDVERRNKRKHAEAKRAFYSKDVKTRKQGAKKACHKFIRERDKKLGCCCCGRPLGKNYDAGHFIESGNAPFLRYHEDNIHAQSVHCNQYKGGDSGDYESRLRLKIGDKRVDWLKDNKHTKQEKRTAEDYRKIEDYYKEKLKMLK